MFRPKSDAITIGTDQIKIPCRNGLQFTSGEEIVFDVPRNVGFADMSNAYVEVDVLIQNPNETIGNLATQPMLMFDKVSGTNACINQVTIRSEGRLIEQLYPYNTYLQAHYNATQDEGMVNKRTRLEGCAKSYKVLDNPFVAPNQSLLAAPDPFAGGAAPLLSNAANGWKYTTRKVCLPILGGVFTNPRSHPMMAMPLSVHILLEDAARCLRVVHAGGAQTDIAVPTAGASASGEEKTQMDNITPAGPILTCASVQAWNSIGGATAEGNISQVDEGETQINPIPNLPYRPGQRVLVQGWDTVAGAAVANERVIQDIGVYDHTAAAGLQNKVAIRFTANVNANAMNNVTISPILQTGQLLTGSGSIGYQWTNPRLVVPKVVPPPSVVQSISRAIAKGGYNQDIISFASYQSAIPASQTTSTNIIPADLSRCKSIISIPCSQTNVSSLKTSNALCGQYLNAESFQYQINNRLVPDRVVNVTRERFPPLYQHTFHEWQAPYQLGQYNEGSHVHEVEKALRNANINVRNLGFITLNNANDTSLQNANRSGSWLVGRSLGAGVGTSENLIGKSVMLYLNYQPAPNGSDMVKLLHNYVSHVRTLSIDMQGVQVFY